EDLERSLHRVIQVPGVFRRVTRCAASAGRQGKIPAHRRGQNDHMKTLLIEEPSEIGGQPKVGVGSDARENEEQRGWVVLAIDGNTHLTASFKGRHVISVGE